MILVVLVLLIFFAVLNLFVIGQRIETATKAILDLLIITQRIEKAVKRVARNLDRPAKELAELEDELEDIRDLASHGIADKDDMKRAEVLEEKIARRTRQQQQP